MSIVKAKFVCSDNIPANVLQLALTATSTPTAKSDPV